jgi:hypothetical protein
MALYRRGRIWYADFYAQGQRVQETTGTANRREAEKFVALRLSEVARGEYADRLMYCLRISGSDISLMQGRTSGPGSVTDRC